jgi:cyclic pyranopterin phosphate synthase
MTDSSTPEVPAIDYLRISITDRCNLRCVYCMPEEGVKALSHDEILTYEELELLAKAAAASGIERVRLTGGEPLVRKGAPDFVGMLTRIEPRLKVSLTTNGILLARYADELKETGLSRVNISLDTLDPDAYREMTRVGSLDQAIDGIRAAIEAGLEPVKINCVVLKGFNDDPTPFVELAKELPVHVRFIEYMPYFEGPTDKWYVPSDVIRGRLEKLGTVEEVESPEGWGPATYVKLEGSEGKLGFISPVSCHFCPTCNRLRVSSEGTMRTCLFDPDGVDMKKSIRSGAGEQALREIIEEQLERKRLEGHRKPVPGEGRVRDHMSRIGG